MHRGGWVAPPWPSAAAPQQPIPPNAAYVDDDSMQCMLRRGIMTGMVGFALLLGLG